MEWNELVEEITARVKKILQEQESLNCEAPVTECGTKKKLLILSPQGSEQCHEVWDSIKNQKEWNITYAAEENYDCDIAAVDTVVLCNVSNERLVKIANGIGDTPLTALATRAILMGKKVIIPTEELELLCYSKSAPAAYYDHMLQYVALLKRSDVVLCDLKQLYSVICEKETCEEESGIKSQQPYVQEKKEILHLGKKVVTERDIHEACTNQITEIRIGKKTIVTDLAKDYARERGIKVIAEM
ncbi:hypothetical protein [Sinanaerobacter sp. ZZT-01]|uniref:hypothetical protein n=1 Tax=Sinanaerobacter sp. ZZT-01 TaxID=3111540 RepID=UPI002D76A24E|nr:hypothetical protein [Sinanaerobacter sp. ZZT-01]WRR92079.1 hypothetical protein U5921_08325 [Sinanaerobacter sp. ZZT-01]